MNKFVLDKRVWLLLFIVLAGTVWWSLSAFGPARGSPAWCDAMQNKPSSQWYVADSQAFIDKCSGL